MQELSEYLRGRRCEKCGGPIKPCWFQNWVAKHCEKSTKGLNVTDLDVLFHRYKNRTDRIGPYKTEYLMVVEIKTGQEILPKNQRDSLSVFNSTLSSVVPVDGRPIGHESKPGFMIKGEKKVVWLGVHMLRIPIDYTEIGPFEWDWKPIDAYTLKLVLNFENDPAKPKKKLDIGRRHHPRRKKLVRAVNAEELLIP